MFNSLDDTTQRDAQLAAMFDALPAVTVHGVVDASGPGAGQIPPATSWSWSLGLIAWRIAGQPIRDSRLEVSKQVSDAELNALQEATCADSLIAFEAKLCEHSPFGDARAQLLRVLDRPVDDALEAILRKSCEPVEMTDPVLGKLVLDRSANCFEAQAMWLGEPIDVSVYPDDDGAATNALQTARTLFGAMEAWADRVSQYAVAELLEIKNDNWLDEDEEPISGEEFIDQMQLASINVYPDGTFDFCHDDGDLFWGHVIEVSGSISDGPSSADIVG